MLTCCLFVTNTIEVSTGPKFPARPATYFCSARPGPAGPGINIIQNLYTGLNILGDKTHENFVNNRYIEKILKISNKFLQNLQFLK